LLPERADENGLVAMGGDLDPRRLLEAYRRGIFPWYDEHLPICWWSPDPRAIFELDGLNISRRFQRTLRARRFQVTVNQDFAQVIRCCADREEGTWILPDMIQAYETLHRLGHAHSVEVWMDGKLAGGLYGVAIGGLFAGESMFSRRPDGSKIALAYAMERLRGHDFQLFDIQFLTDHTARLGAVTISRRQYLRRLRRALKVEATFAQSPARGFQLTVLGDSPPHPPKAKWCL
jgi:leucyl/phenylalanyl-tRNA--protein transferase